MKMTTWFGGNRKPMKIGVYQRMFPISVRYCYWDGLGWHVGGMSPKAARYKGMISDHQDLPWRGLAEDPSKVKK